VTEKRVTKRILIPYKLASESSLREENKKDFQKNIKPVLDQLETWRKESATSTQPSAG
jgi:hypothetical protein